MSESARRFAVTLPDWGQDHLSPEAIVAFVDHELADGPHTRATRHLDACPDCATQVVAQGQARSALRSAGGPRMPSSLLSSLCSIPQHTDLPGAPAGLAVTADGQFVSVLRPERPQPSPPTADHGRRTTGSRRMRFGAGAVLSGLALGVIALGASGVAGDAASAVPAQRGVLDGGAPGARSVLDAQLRLTPASRPGDVPGDTMRIPVTVLHLR